MFITGNIATEELVDRTGTYSSPPSENSIVTRVSAETGINATGLFCYYEADKTIQKRVLANDEFDLVWDDVYWETVDVSGVVTASGYNHQIVSLDFSTEDSKNYLSFSVSEEDFDADGVDELRISVEIKNPNLSELVNYNGRINIPSLTPNGPAKIGFRFVGGKASKAISTTKAGGWKVPASRFVPGYRIANSVEFNSVL